MVTQICTGIQLPVLLLDHPFLFYWYIVGGSTRVAEGIVAEEINTD